MPILPFTYFDLQPIFDLLLNHRGQDISSFNLTYLNQTISKQLQLNQISELSSYIAFLKRNDHALKILIEAIAINVSGFFRDPFSFMVFEKLILPALVEQNKSKKVSDLRIWSAGCATGEEVYSIVILINELCRNSEIELPGYYLATDIKEDILTLARQGKYQPEKLKDTRLEFVTGYFELKSNQYKLKSQIRDRVYFEHHDLLDNNHRFPPHSVYGDFNLILLRNVLYYYTPDTQANIFRRVTDALAKNGYLFIGESEMIHPDFTHLYNKCYDGAGIYQKRELK